MTGPIRILILGNTSEIAAPNFGSATPNTKFLIPKVDKKFFKSSASTPSVTELRFTNAAWAVLKGENATWLAIAENLLKSRMHSSTC